MVNNSNFRGEREGGRERVTGRGREREGREAHLFLSLSFNSTVPEIVIRAEGTGMLKEVAYYTSLSILFIEPFIYNNLSNLRVPPKGFFWPG